MGAKVQIQSNQFLPLGKVRMGLRLGGGCNDWLNKSLTKQSNLSLPFGKARMGCPLGKVRMGYPWGRNKLLLQITISPHLASPEGEGQIHLTG